MEDNYNVQIANENAFQGYSNDQQSQIIGIAATSSIDFDPIMCAWTCVFKIMQIVFYFVFKFVLGSELLTFILVVLLVSFDFWVTKNLTGRKLAGLRWWTDYNQYQEEQWVFQSSDPSVIINKKNENYFWLCQILIVLFWAVLSLVNLITLSFFWVLLAIFGGFLSGLNLACFFKCRGNHQNKAQTLIQKIGIPGLI